MTEGGKINILDESVIGKIAAGEVVENPASVVKELVENSIDAGADSITGEVQGGGQALIRVADNGAGMSQEDAEKACFRHSTSKIVSAEDLNRIMTLGFRGEALSSISAVSQMDLVTKTETDQAGTEVYLESGEVLKVKPAGRSRGTTVEVRNLFYNVPARRKFLRKESTELAEIVSVVGRFIIMYPGIEFKLIQGERVLVHALAGMGPLERIRLVLGGDVADHMTEVGKSLDKCSVRGFTSLPSSTRKDRKAQLFFVNGRFVRSRVLNDAVYGSYKSLLERGRYPSAVLFLDLPPSDVDVNVHPAKLQVKFESEREIKDAVRETITESFVRLKEKDAEPSIFTFPTPAAGAKETEQVSRAADEEAAAGGLVFVEGHEVQPEFAYDPASRTGAGSTVKSPEAGLSARGRSVEDTGKLFQINDCYIVRMEKDGLTIVDQHAAHERVLYELFSKAKEESPVEVQSLLFPVRLDLSAEEALVMDRIISDCRVIGFHIEVFGERSFVVQAVPAVLRRSDIKSIIHDVIVDLASGYVRKKDMADELVKLASCHAAIRAGDPLTVEEMETLLEELDACELPFTCPHGRPTSTRITVDELEKRFRRK